MRDIVCEKSHDEVAVLLEQIVLSPVATVVFGVLEVKRPVNLDGQFPLRAQKIDLHERIRPEGDGEASVKHEKPLCPRQSV